MLKAHQRLEADGLLRAALYKGLEMKEELPFKHPLADQVLDAQEIVDGGIHLLAVVDETVLARFFGRIHGGIGMFDKIAAGIGMVGIEGDADGTGDEKFVFTDGKWVAESLDQGGHEMFDIAVVVDISQQNDELVTAEAGADRLGVQDAY